ncbi:MAG: toll/interleukin-1 receptor domain-containing protein, partial [Methylococcales bacterium]
MIFISYSRKNMDLLQGFRIHLRALFDEKDLFWTDNEIKADQQWDQEIKTALKDCKIAVMLISPTFLASGYIRDQEIPILLERRESEQIKLTSLYLVDSVVGHDDAAFKINVNGRERSIKLTEYQGLNTPGAPIAKFTRNHRAEEYKKAAINFKGLWDSVHHPSFPAQKTDRKQLTVTLEKNSKQTRLYQCFYYQDQKIEARPLPWDDRF